MSPNISFNLDTSIVAAHQAQIEAKWDFDVFGGCIEDVIIQGTAEDVLMFFKERFDAQYKVYFGTAYLVWGDDFTIRYEGSSNNREAAAAAGVTIRANNNFDREITITGRREKVKEIIRSFFKEFADRIKDAHRNIDWITMGMNGPDTMTLPVKSDMAFYPEMYPYIKDPRQYIDDFINSNANVLLMMGDPGLGKSSFINWVIHSTRMRTSVIYDIEVMKSDSVYASFISGAFRGEGSIMILEDADLILSSRDVSNNKVMSKILNVSDGIIDTSKAKFIFTTNLRDTSEIDSALIRPGRCFDVLQFRPLDLEEARVAAAAIGKELIEEPGKNQYTAAEIFNSRINRNERKPEFKFGFGGGK